jgi:hypothetical protein
MIRTIDVGGAMESFPVGTLAGAGSFKCEDCGFTAALHGLDELPACPHCGGTSYRRASIFAEHVTTETSAIPATLDPDWLAEAREALITPGAYVAYEDDERVRVVALQDGWTRLGRSMSAHVRFDDPTVSRRHALIHRDEASVRILDDRSLNGLFLNGERVDWHELCDGDRITVGRFDLHFIGLRGRGAAAAPGAFAAGGH